MEKYMGKTFRIVLIVIAFIVAASGAAGGVYLFYILPRQEAVAEMMARVIIPEIFARYTEEIQLANQIVRENPQLMRDGSHVTLQELQGFFDLPLKQKVAYQQIRAPGDPRPYRNGIHQGIDFYQTKRGDPIYAAAPGVVIRIDKE
jgi:murein DD-endopeptidase MepM/ murein hydrolase activator NlpD